MLIEVKSSYRSLIRFENNQLKAIGSEFLLFRLQELVKSYGYDFQTWPILKPIKNDDEILINEFVEKAQNKVFIYPHDELCHCRMIQTSVVRNAIKQGCRSVGEISRTTLAGTGCGACRVDSEKIIKLLTE